MQCSVHGGRPQYTEQTWWALRETTWISAIHSLKHQDSAQGVCGWSSGCALSLATCGHQKGIWVVGTCYMGASDLNHFLRVWIGGWRAPPLMHSDLEK